MCILILGMKVNVSGFFRRMYMTCVYGMCILILGMKVKVKVIVNSKLVNKVIVNSK